MNTKCVCEFEFECECVCVFVCAYALPSDDPHPTFLKPAQPVT